MFLIAPKRKYDMFSPTVLLQEVQLKPQIRSLSFQHHVENDDNHFCVSMDLPGMKLQDLDITEDNGVLQVTGVRKSSSSSGGTTKKLRFTKSFLLPDRVDIDNIQAKLVNGVLTMDAPKIPKPEPRQFKIESSRAATTKGQENEEDFQIYMDVPGVKVQDITVTENHDGILHVSATRKFSTGDGIIRRFDKRFSVPERVNLEELKASLMDGVLEVRAPRIPKPSPQQIRVETNKEEQKATEDDKKDVNTEYDASENDFSVSIDLPGVTAQDLKLEEENGVLRVSGFRKKAASNSDSTRQQQAAGQTMQGFLKVFILPDRVEVTKLNATLRDGVLVVRAPKTPLPQPRTIVIHQQESKSLSDDKKLETLLEKKSEAEDDEKEQQNREKA